MLEHAWFRHASQLPTYHLSLGKLEKESRWTITECRMDQYFRPLIAKTPTTNTPTPTHCSTQFVLRRGPFYINPFAINGLNVKSTNQPLKPQSFAHHEKTWHISTHKSYHPWELVYLPTFWLFFFDRKCRYIYHTWMLWARGTSNNHRTGAGYGQGLISWHMVGSGVGTLGFSWTLKVFSRPALLNEKVILYKWCYSWKTGPFEIEKVLFL